MLRSSVVWFGPILAGALTMCAAAVARADDVNLVGNPSFEEVAKDQPRGWQASRWNGEAKMELATRGHTGSRCAAISSTSGADVAWSCTVPVEMMSRYRLSGWIRTDDIHPKSGGHGALLNIHNIQPVQTSALSGTLDWTAVSVEFDTEEKDAVTINCLFGGWGTSTGQAWYDDISLTLLKRGEVPAPRIVVDTAQPGAPISKYIYGQFIEHLGRCINGGIWAEMIEDRKFFYPVGDRESPWREIGRGCVTMDAKEPFVGIHSPQISLRTDESSWGIAQGDLAVRPGMKYVGYIWLAGDPSAAPVQVSLVPPVKGGGPTVMIKTLTADFKRYDLEFEIKADVEPSEHAELQISSPGKGSFRVGAVSLMPAGHIGGMRADTLRCMKELDSPVYRWPGGNFVSGYDWRDGVGERDRRPPRKNPAWAGIEPNDFGLNEFFALCRELKTDPYIAMNTGLGTVENAVAELEYMNGAADTPMGKLRAAHGHPEPYGVRFIGIGNEMYGDWQLGHVPLADYTRRHNEFVDALRKVDPKIRVIGVGAVGQWSETMLRDCADRMDYLSEHAYWGAQPGVFGHVRQASDSIHGIAEAHRKYRREIAALQGRDIRLCQDEWNYWYGPEVFGQIGPRYFLKDALGCAAALHEFYRNSDLFFMANYAQTVNVIGAIKTSKTAAALETTGLVLKLYRHHFGEIPVATETTPLIDAQAAWLPDRKTLTVGVVNPSAQARSIPFEFRGAKFTGSGQAWEIAGDDPLAFNDPDSGMKVHIAGRQFVNIGDVLDVSPYSVTLFELRME